MKIIKIETVTLNESTEVHAGRVSWLWVRLHTDQGIYGLGETFPGSASERAVILSDFAPALLGRDPRDIERIWNDLFLQVQYRGWAGAEMRALSAIDVALWDLLGKSSGLPVYMLLGGKFWDSVPVYNTCYDDTYDFNEQPAELAADLLKAGITAMKIWPFDRVARRNVGQSISQAELTECIEPIRRIRNAFGYKIQIMVEFHGFWNLPCAVKIAKALEPYDVEWLEEMIPQDNMAAYATLASRITQPLCISERLLTRWQFRELLELGPASVIMPDLAWCGGLTETKKIAVLASTYYLPIALHNCAGPVTHFASWHLAIATPNLKTLETVRRHYNHRYPEMATANGAPEAGRLGLPPGPGLGVDLTERFLHSSRVKLHAIDESKSTAYESDAN
jgi:L-alanine-DL-glutamate epimerase-like enolase superfamily enzyme